MRQLHHRQEAVHQLPMCHVMPWSSAESGIFGRPVGTGWQSGLACFVGALLTVCRTIWQDFIKLHSICRSAMRLKNTTTRQP